MKRSIIQIFLWVVLLYPGVSRGQDKLTYYRQVEPILSRHCVECHRAGGVAPFTLTSYTGVARRAKFITKVTESGYMPPFKADRTFQQYANERGLTPDETQTLRLWYEQGAVEGKKTTSSKGNTQESRKKEAKSAKNVFEYMMAKPYSIRGDGKEDFRYFNIPTELKEDIYVEAIEFIPGNRKVLHHSRLMTDTTRSMRAIDGMSETDPRVREFQKTPLEDEFLYGWVPGNDRITFPKGTAKRIRAGTDLVLNMHYAPSATYEADQSTVRFYRAEPTPAIREVQTLTLTENDITNQPFVLPANTRPAFFISYGPLQEDISLISVLPHMHQLGKTLRAFAITAGGDLVPLVKINDWDFNWQMTYQFKKMLHLPAGSVIVVEATYDNTAENPENPSSPPRDVTYGWNSTDEMLNLVLYYVPYQPGDEERVQETH